MPDGSSIDIDIRIAAAGWRTALPGPAALVRRIVRATLKAELPAKAATGLSILLTDDAEMRKLNAGWRAKDKPTNVLSFPADAAINPARPPAYLGDIALGLATCRREAKEQGKTLADHVAHLTVHGVLHLLGYDHMDDEQAAAMEPREVEILAGLKIADPYQPTRKAPVKSKAAKPKAARKKAAAKKTVKKKKAAPIRAGKPKARKKKAA